jgi:hypothetical protein
MPPKPVTSPRDTSISSQPTPTPSPSLPSYMPSVITVSIAMSLLVLSTMTVYLRRLWARRRAVKFIDRLDVDISIDVYTNTSEPEAQVPTLSSTRQKLKERVHVEEPPSSISLNASSNRDRIQTGASSSSASICIRTPSAESGRRNSTMLCTRSSNLSLAGMLGSMDVDFFTRSTIRFPRKTGSPLSPRSVGPIEIDESDALRMTQRVSGEICSKLSRSNHEQQRTRQRTLDSLLKPVSQANPSRSCDSCRTVSRTYSALCSSRKFWKSTASAVESERPPGSNNFCCGCFKRHPPSSSISVPPKNFGDTILNLGSDSVEMDIADVLKASLRADAIVGCESPICVIAHNQRVFAQQHVTVPVRHLNTDPSMPGGRRQSTGSSLFLSSPHCSPLVQTSLTPLQSFNSPSYCASPPFIDLDTCWQEATPLLSLELDFGSDITLIGCECATSMELISSSSETTVPSMDELALVVSPQIFVRSTEAQYPSSCSQLGLGTKWSNLLEQPEPPTLRSPWHETSIPAPPIHDIARVRPFILLSPYIISNFVSGSPASFGEYEW